MAQVWLLWKNACWVRVQVPDGAALRVSWDTWWCELVASNPGGE